MHLIEWVSANHKHNEAMPAAFGQVHQGAAWIGKRDMISRLNLTVFLGIAVALSGCVSEPASRTKPRAVPANFHSLMPPQSLLREDTVEAASHDRSLSRLAYVGVWAKSGDACAMMDQTAFDGYAVITPGSIRQPGSDCTFEPAAAGEGEVQLNAACTVKRKTTRRAITLQMENSERLRLTEAGHSISLVRCHLPG